MKIILNIAISLVAAVSAFKLLNFYRWSSVYEEVVGTTGVDVTTYIFIIFHICVVAFFLLHFLYKRFSNTVMYAYIAIALFGPIILSVILYAFL